MALGRKVSRSGDAVPVMEWLKMASRDASLYASTAERMLKAIGKPRMVDTSTDPRLSRVFENRLIPYYEVFEDFYGIEDSIQAIVAYFKAAAQGLEERKQILYLLGPVGGGKSSLADKLKWLMEQEPVYVLACVHNGNLEVSPVFEHPFGLFDPISDAQTLEQEYSIPRHYLGCALSPWAMKRLASFGGDISRFSVVQMRPSVQQQIAIAATVAGDENNQDIAALVGKIDIRKLEKYAQNDPDAYSYSGALCRANQGIMEFVEMFKAPIKMLNPILEATQSRRFAPTEEIGMIPFQGIILAHSNESEWEKFRGNKTNEAFLDRVHVVKVPYCLRVSEEVRIYRKLLAGSSLGKAPCVPMTLETLAKFIVQSRIVKTEDAKSALEKIRIYDGDNLKDTAPKAKSRMEWREISGPNEGMTGLSTRWAFQVLSRIFNFDPEEVAANPVHLLYVLEKELEKTTEKEMPEKARHLAFLKELKEIVLEFLTKAIQSAYLESYSEYGQNLFDRYVQYADFWIQDNDYRDPSTGEVLNRAVLNAELEKIEKPAGISNPKDFRHEIVNFVLRARANNGGKNPVWTSYEKLRLVIEKRMFANTEDLLPIISFSKKSTQEEERKHQDFVDRMVKAGFTRKQVHVLCDWYVRARKSS